MTPRKIIGLLLLVASSLLLFIAAQRHVGWDVLIIAAVLMVAGMWVGEFKFKKDVR